jgi:hypothetical protein
MKAGELRLIEQRADQEVLSTLSAAGITGSVRTKAREDGDGNLVTITEVTMRSGQRFDYADLSTALRRARGGDSATITQNGKLGAMVRW